MEKNNDLNTGVYAPAAKPHLEEGVFRHPFSRAFWKYAAAEFKNPRMLVFAAMILAMRILVKQLKIPIAPPDLYFGFDFIINSAGSMIYGPVMALLVGAISDTLGAILFPIGPYFFPYIFMEMFSGFIFGMFLYRQKLSAWRIVLSRLAVVVVCNYLIQPVVSTAYNYFLLDKPYTFITLFRVIKSVATFPLEAIVLVLWLNAVWRPLYILDLVRIKPDKLKVKAEHIVAIVLAVMLSAAAVFGFIKYKEYRKKQKAQKKASFSVCAAQSAADRNFPFEYL